jgi:hypothetical protein
LIEAFEAPMAGEAGRPTAVCLTRKAWFRSWRSKLKDIGVECRLVDSVDKIDRWHGTAIPQMEQAQRAATASSPADAEWSELSSLPQSAGEIWQADARQLPAWIQVAGEPVRPWIGLVAEVESGAILATDMSTEKPAEDWLLTCVWQAMTAPAVGEPHRPAIIQVTSDRQRELLAARLAPVGIQCVRKPGLKLSHLIDEFAAHLGGERQHRRALVRSPGIKAAHVGRFFEAAAYFYRARPWRKIPGDSIIRVTSERFESGPWYAVVRGQSGIEQGLALYEDLQLLETLLTGQLSDKDYGRRTSALSLTYGEPFEIAPEDFDQAQEHGWPVAGPEAYPCVLRVNPGMALRTPLKWELELLEACLRAIPDFLGTRAEQAEIAVDASSGAFMLRLERLEEQSRRRRR